MSTKTQVTTQELINDTQIRLFIISNHASKSIADMAKDLGIVHQQVTAKYKVLVRENVISREESLPKGVTTKTPRVKKEPIKKHKSKTILEAIDETNRQLEKLNKNIESAEKLKINELGDYTGGGKQKVLAREKMINYITKTGVEGVVPSLMFTNTYIEETILKTLPKMEFIGIDDNPKVISVLKKKIRAKK